MNKIQNVIFLVVVSINCFGQLNYEKGYFIDNQNKKTDCFIKNEDWLNNPQQFKYILSENGNIYEGDINDVKEFCIHNSFKFIRADVDIDASSSLLNDLSMEKNPIWQHKRIFLKVLIEGNAKLYIYNEGNYERFFYLCKDSVIKQLIYKEYFYDSDQRAFNNTFRQQLYTDLNCTHIKLNSINSLDCNQNDLEKYFQHYNSCTDSSYIVIKSKRDMGEFSVGLSTGLNYSSISITNDYTSYADANFKKNVSPLFSFEIEYILPFKNHKWGVAIGPTYQSYNSEKQTNFGYVTVDLKSIDLALGLKHFFLLNGNAKFHINCYVNSLSVYCINSKIGYRPDSSQDFSFIDIDKYKINFILGAGFEYKRVFAGLRYFSNQNILSKFPSWDSSYEKISFSIGYKIIKTKCKNAKM